MNFSQKFLELRKKSGLSQEEAADKLGVSRQAISRWEQGTAYPDSFNLLQISKLFCVSADYLIDDERQGDEKTQMQKLSEGGRQGEVTQQSESPDDGRRALRAAAWPYLTACAICVVLLSIIGVVVAFYANAAAGTAVLSFAAAVAIAGIVAAAVIYRPAPVNHNKHSANQRDRTSLCLFLMVCFHIGALILELVGLVLLFCYSEATITYLLTGFGVLLSVAGCITFECVFHGSPAQSRSTLRRKYYRISVWLFSPFLIMNVVFAIAMNGGGRVVIGGVIVGSIIIYVAISVLVTFLLRERKNK